MLHLIVGILLILAGYTWLVLFAAKFLGFNRLGDDE